MTTTTPALKSDLSRGAQYIAPPPGSLARITEAAKRDLVGARLALGLFQLIFGIEQELFRGYRSSLFELSRFPANLQQQALTLVNWALTPGRHDRSSVLESHREITRAVHQLRRISPLGKRFRRRARRLMRQYPARRVDNPRQLVILSTLLPEEVGRPLTERTIASAKGLKPRTLQIVPHDAYPNAVYAPGALAIRLAEDGYTVREITIAIEIPEKSLNSKWRRIEGELIDFFETGTEGVVWTLEDDRRIGRAACETICEGDHLTIFDRAGNVLWRGVIRCDKKSGWRRYPRNPQYGQQSALGCWVHWIQKGFRPDDWARFFIRPKYDRLHAILVRKRGSSRNPRLGPEAIPPSNANRRRSH